MSRRPMWWCTCSTFGVLLILCWQKRRSIDDCVDGDNTNQCYDRGMKRQYGNVQMEYDYTGYHPRDVAHGVQVLQWCVPPISPLRLHIPNSSDGVRLYRLSLSRRSPWCAGATMVRPCYFTIDYIYQILPFPLNNDNGLCDKAENNEMRSWTFLRGCHSCSSVGRAWVL